MKLIALLTLTLIVSCGKDESMKIIHNNDRVTMLEARMQLAESNIQLTNSRIDVLENRVSVVESELSSLQVSSAEADAQLQANIDALSDETAQSISDILAQIDSLNETDEDLQDQINSLSNQLSLAIAGLNGDVAGLSAALASTQSQLNQVKNRVAALEASQFVQNVILAGMAVAISDLYDGLATVQSNQSALASQVSSLAGQVSSLANQVNNLPESLTEAQVQALIDSAISPLQAQIAALQSQVNNLPTTPASSCSVSLTANYGHEKHYSFSVSGITPTSYEVQLSFTQPNKVDDIDDNNGGLGMNNNYSPYRFFPINSQSSVMFYVDSDNSANVISGAKVIKNGQTINCSVSI